MKNIQLSNEQWDLVSNNQELVKVTIKALIKKIPLIKNDIDEYNEAGMWALINSARKFDIERNTKFSTYAITAIRREIIHKVNEKIKSQQRTKHIEDDFIEPFGFDRTLDNMIDSEIISKLKKLCKKLPERDKKIVQMRFCEGKTFNEIGQSLKVTGEMARIYYNQILSLLNKQLTGV